MASISLNLDSRTKKNGMSPVRLRISHRSTNCFIPTGVCVEPEYFDGSNLRQPIFAKYPSSKIKNEQIAMLIRKYDEVIFEIQRDENLHLDDMTANDIRKYIIGERAPKRVHARKQRNSGRVDFMEWFDTYGQERLCENTRKHYAYAWRLLYKYCQDRNMKTIYLDDITYRLLVDIRKWVLNGRSDVTRYKLESYMHAAYKEAQRMRMISRDDDPYLDFRVDKAARTTEDIDTISLKDLQRFLSLDLTNQQGVAGLSRARDILWASFCLCGVNLTDLYHMPKMHDDELVYIRRKNRNHKNTRNTHAHIGVEVEDIIERYAGKDYLFNWKELVPNYYTFQRRLNNRCERLSKLNGAQVNMQLIRRTWATIAGEVGVDWHTVNKSLGHTDKETTDIHYMRFDWSRAADANRKVIDYVLRGVVPNSVKVPKLFRA